MFDPLFFKYLRTIITEMYRAYLGMFCLNCIQDRQGPLYPKQRLFLVGLELKQNIMHFCLILYNILMSAMLSASYFFKT